MVAGLVGRVTRYRLLLPHSGFDGLEVIKNGVDDVTANANRLDVDHKLAVWDRRSSTALCAQKIVTSLCAALSSCNLSRLARRWEETVAITDWCMSMSRGQCGPTASTSP